MSRAVDAAENMFTRWERQVSREGRDPETDYGCEVDEQGQLVWWMPERAMAWLLCMEMR